MMTPRGVADVHVYTPERVTARLGVPPEKVPDLIGLKGDTSDSIAGVPGIGDKTAAQLIQQFDSVEGVLEHVDELSPARAKVAREHADQARESKVLATMRRDLDIDCDPTELVLAPPDRSRAAGDVPPLRVPRPARSGSTSSTRRCLRPRRPLFQARTCRGAQGGSPRLLPEVVRARGRRRTRAQSRPATRSSITAAGAVLTGARSSPTTRSRYASRRRRRHAARRVPHRARASRLRLGRPRRRVRHRRRAVAADRRGDGGARPPRRAAAAARSAHARTAGRARPRPAVRGRRAAAHARARARWRTPASRSTRIAWARSPRGSRERVEELESLRHELAGEEFMLGSTQQVARVLFETARPDARAEGKDGLLDRHARSSDDPRRARDRSRDRGVA